MASTLKLSLTEELRAFVDENCGEGALYTTPSEFVEDLIRREKARKDAAAIREAIIEGYEDIIAGRVVEFDDNLDEILERARKR